MPLIQPSLTGYTGTTTILEGHDRESLATLIPLHSSESDPRILDATWGKGKMWEDCPYQPDVRMDIRELKGVDVVGDFRNTDFDDDEFDIVVFDPPHLPGNSYTDGSSKIYNHKYSITTHTGNKWNVNDLFLPFLLEAQRILKPDGIVLAKIADIVHNHRYQWQQVAFVNAAMEAGMTPCDMQIKIDPAAGNLKSSKWQNQYHLRKAHCYWIVVRNSSRCERWELSDI